MTERERAASRRRRLTTLILTIASLVVFFVRGQQPHLSAAPIVKTSPTPAASVVAPVVHTPVARVLPHSPSPSPSVSPSPSPTPDGPPFVLDAAPSCAGATALIDIQVATIAKRPIVKLELLLDGVAAPLTPNAAYPMRSYAGRSSGKAAAGGSGSWVIRATDKKGIVEEKTWPYVCGA